MPPPSTVLGKLRAPDEPLQTRVQDAVWGTLMPLAERVGKTPIMGAAPPPWLRPDIISTSGFAQATAGVTPFLPLTAFHKDALGYVHGKVGLITAAGVAGNITAFTMPIACRPLELMVAFMGDGGGVNVWETFVRPNGSFVIVDAVGAGGIVVGTFTYLAEQ